MKHLHAFAMRFCAVALFLAFLAGFGKFNTAKAQTDILYQTNFGTSLQRTGAGGMNSIFLTGSNNPSTKSNYKGPDEIYDQGSQGNKWKVSYGAVSVWNNLTGMGKCLVVGFHTSGTTEPADINRYNLDGIKTNCVAYLEMEWNESNVDGVAFDVYHAWDDGVCAGLYVSEDDGTSWNEAVSVKALPKGEPFTIVDNKHYDGPCRFALLVFREASEWNFRQATRLIVTRATIYTNRVRTPELSPVPGIYPLNTSVSISSATTGAKLYYATDGSTPTTEYTSPLPFTQKQAAFITAMGTKTGKTNSFTAEGVYFFTNDTNLIKADFNTCTKSEAKKVSVNATGYGYENWGASNAYQADGCVAIGLPSRSNNGTLTTPTLTDKDDDLPYTVEFFAKKVISGTCNLKVGSAPAFNLTQNWTHYSHEFTDKSTTVAFASQTGTTTAFVDNICIWQDHSPQIWNIPANTINLGEKYANETASYSTISFKPKYLNKNVKIIIETSRPDVFTFSGIANNQILDIEAKPAYKAKGEAIEGEVIYTGKGNVAQDDWAIVRFRSVDALNGGGEIDTSFRIEAKTLACSTPVVNGPVIKQHVISGSFARAGLSGEKYWWQFKADNGAWKASDQQLTGSTFEEKSLTANTIYHAMLWHECGTAHAYSDTVRITKTTLDYEQAEIKLTSPVADKPDLDEDGGFTVRYTVSGLALNNTPNDSTPNGYVEITVEGCDTLYSVKTQNLQQRLDFPRSGDYTVTIKLYKNDDTPMPGEPADTVRVYTVDFPDVENLKIVPDEEYFIERQTVAITCAGSGISIKYKLHPDSAYKKYTAGATGFEITESTTVYAFATKAKYDTAWASFSYTVEHSKIVAPTPRYIDWGSTDIHGNTLTKEVSFFYQYIRSDDSVFTVKITGNRGSDYSTWSYSGAADGRPSEESGKYGAISGSNTTMYEGKIKIAYGPKLHGFDTAKVVVYNRYARDSFYICVEGKATLNVAIANKKPGSNPDTVESASARLNFTVYNAKLASDRDRVKITLRGPVNMDSLADHTPFYLNGLKSGNYTLTVQLVHDGNKPLTEEKTIPFTVDLPDLKKPAFSEESGTKCNRVSVEILPNNTGVDVFYSTDTGKTWTAYTEAFVWTLPGKTSFKAMVTKAGSDTAWSDLITYNIEKTFVSAQDTNLGETSLYNISKAIPLTYGYANAHLRVEIVKATRPGVFTINEDATPLLLDSVLRVNGSNVCKAEVTESITFVYGASTHGKDTAWVKVYNNDVNKDAEYTFFVAAETKAAFTFVKPDRTGDFNNRDSLLVSILPYKVDLGEGKDHVCIILEGQNTGERHTQETVSTDYTFKNLKTDDYTLTVALVDNSGDTLYKGKLTPIRLHRTRTAKPYFINPSSIYCRRVAVDVVVPDPDADAALEYATAPKSTGPWTGWQSFTAHDYTTMGDTVWYKVRAAAEHKDATESDAVWYKIPQPVLETVADVDLDSTFDEKSRDITVKYQYLIRDLKVEFEKNGRNGNAFTLGGDDFIHTADGDSIRVYNTCQPNQQSSFSVTYHPTVHGSDTAVIKVWNAADVVMTFKVIAYAKPNITITRPMAGEDVVDRDSIRVLCALTNADLDGGDQVRILLKGDTKGYNGTYTGKEVQHDFIGLLTDGYTLTVQLLDKNGEVIASETRHGHVTRKKVKTPGFDPDPDLIYSNKVDVKIASSTPGAAVYYAYRYNESDAWSEWIKYTGTVENNHIGNTYYQAMAVKDRMDTSDIATATYKVARTAITVQNFNMGWTKDSMEKSVPTVKYTHATGNFQITITPLARSNAKFSLRALSGSTGFVVSEDGLSATFETVKKAEEEEELDFAIKYLHEKWGLDSAEVCISSVEDDLNVCFKVYAETKAIFRFAAPTPTENQSVDRDSIAVDYRLEKAVLGERSTVALKLTGPYGYEKSLTSTDRPYTGFNNLLSGDYVLTATLISIEDNDYVVDTTAPRHFKIQLQPVETPVITRRSGTYPDSVLVPVTCATSGAAIFYTLDNGATWTKYEKPVKLEYNADGSARTYTFRAKAVRKGMDTSDLSAVYTYKVVKATFKNIAELHEKVFSQPTFDTIVYRLTDPVLITVRGTQNRRAWLQDTAVDSYASLEVENVSVENNSRFNTGSKVIGVNGYLSRDSVMNIRLATSMVNTGEVYPDRLKNEPVTIAALNSAGGEEWQNKYVTIQNVQFENITEGQTFNRGQVYTLKGLGENAGYTIPFLALSYLQGAPIERDPVDVRGIILFTKTGRHPQIGTDTSFEIIRRLQPKVDAGADFALNGIYNNTASKNFNVRHKDVNGNLQFRWIKNPESAKHTPAPVFSLNTMTKAVASGRDWKDETFTVTYTARDTSELHGATAKDTAVLEVSYQDAAGKEYKDTVYIAAQTLYCGVKASGVTVQIYPYAASVNFANPVSGYRFKHWMVTGGSQPDDYSPATGNSTRNIDLPVLLADTLYKVVISLQCAADPGVWGPDTVITFRTLQAETPTVQITSPTDRTVIPTHKFTVKYKVSKYAITSQHQTDIKYGYLEIKLNDQRKLYTNDSTNLKKSVDGLSFEYDFEVETSGEYKVTVSLVNAKKGGLDETVDEKTYIVDLPDVAHVKFNPKDSTYIVRVSDNIALSCDTADAEIFYKVNNASVFTKYNGTPIPAFSYENGDNDTNYIYTKAVKHLRDTTFDTARYILVHPNIQTLNLYDIGEDFTALNNKKIVFTYSHLLEDIEVTVQSATRSSVFTVVKPTVSVTKGLGKYEDTLEFNYTSPRYGDDTAVIRLKSGSVIKEFKLKARINAYLTVSGVPVTTVNNPIEADSVRLKFSAPKVSLKPGYEYVHITWVHNEDNQTFTQDVYDTAFTLRNLRTGHYELHVTLFNNKGEQIIDAVQNYEFYVGLPQMDVRFIGWSTTPFCNTARIEVECDDNEADIYYTIDSGAHWTAYNTAFDWDVLGSTSFMAMAVKAHKDTAYNGGAKGTYRVYRIERSFVGIPDIKLDFTKNTASGTAKVSYAYVNTDLMVWIEKNTPQPRPNPFSLSGSRLNATKDTLYIENKCSSLHDEEFNVNYEALRYGYDTALIKVANSRTKVDTFFYVYGRTLPTFRVARPESRTFERDSIEVAYNFNKVDLADGTEYVHMILKGDKYGVVKDTVLRGMPYKITGLKSDRYTLIDTLFNNRGQLVDTTATRTFTIQLPNVRIPHFTAPTNSYANRVKVEIASETEDATIFYRVNGGEWKKYDTAFMCSDLGENRFEAMGVKAHMDTAWSEAVRYTIVKSAVWFDGAFDLGSTKDSIRKTIRVHYRNLSENLRVKYIEPTNRADAFKLNILGDSLLVHQAIGENWAEISLVYRADRYGQDQAYILFGNGDCEDTLKVTARTLATFRHRTPPVPENESLIKGEDSVKVAFNVVKATIAEGLEQVHLKLVGQKQGVVKDTFLRHEPLSIYNLRTDRYTLYDTLLDNNGVRVDTTAPRIFNIELNKVKTPTFTPNPDIYANGVNVTINCDEADAKLFYSVDNGATWTAYTGEIALDSTVHLLAMAAKPHMDTAWTETVEYTVVKSRLDIADVTDLGSTQTDIPHGGVTFTYTNINEPIQVEILRTTRPGNAEFNLLPVNGLFAVESNQKKGRMMISGDLDAAEKPVTRGFEMYYNAQTHGFDTAWVRFRSEKPDHGILVDTTVKVVAQTRTRFRISVVDPVPQNNNRDADSMTVTFLVWKADQDENSDRIRMYLVDANNRNRVFDTVFFVRDSRECKIKGLKTGSYILYDTLYHTDGKMIDTTAPYRFSVNLPDVAAPVIKPGSATYGDSVEMRITCWGDDDAQLYYTVDNGKTWTDYRGPFVWKTPGTYTFKAMAVKAHKDTGYSQNNSVIKLVTVTYPSLAALKREVFDKNAIEDLNYTVTGDVVVTGVHPHSNWHRFWVQDADRNEHGAIVIDNYNEQQWNLRVGDKLGGLTGTIRVSMEGEEPVCNETKYSKQPYRIFTLEGDPVLNGSAEPYVDTVTYDTIMSRHYEWQSRLVCVRNVRVEDLTTPYKWAHRSYADGDLSHEFYVDVQDNEILTGHAIEPDSFNVTGLVQIRQLNVTTIWCDRMAYGTLFPRDFNDIDRIPQPGVEAGDTLYLPFIFEDKLDTAVAVQSKDVHGDITVALGKNTRGAFTLHTTKITANSGRRFDTADTKVGLTYNFRPEGGFDTAVVVISYDKWRDSMYVVAESRLCTAPSTGFKVVDSVIYATVTFDSAAAGYMYRYAAAKTALAGAEPSTKFNSESFELDGLRANTKYYYQLQSWCGTTAHSDWSKVDSFTTRQPVVTIQKPQDGQTYYSIMDMAFEVRNMHLGYEVPHEAPVNHLPYGWANMQLFRKMEHLGGRYVRVANTDSIIEPTNRRLIPSGEYRVKITLIPTDKKAEGDSAAFTDQIDYTVNLPDLADPRFTPAPGTYYDSLQVAVSCDSAFADLLYSYDGKHFVQYDPENKPWIKPGQTTIYAKAVQEGYDTALVTGVYTLRPLYKLPNIAALYEAELGYTHDSVNTDRYYYIDGKMTVTHVDSSGINDCRIFVQDIDKSKTHGRSLVMLLPADHRNIHVTDSSIREGDVIKGVRGRVSANGNLMRFTLVDSAIVPIERGHDLFIDTVTVLEFRDRTIPFQSDLACVKYVHFTTYVEGFSDRYTFSMSGKGGGERNSFSLYPGFKYADYMPGPQSVDTVIPKNVELFLTGILSTVTSNGKEQFTPRGWRDFAMAPYLEATPRFIDMPVIYGGSWAQDVAYRFGYWTPEDLQYEFLVNGTEMEDCRNGIFECNGFGSNPLDIVSKNNYEGRFGFDYKFQNADKDDTLAVALSLYDLKDTAYIIGHSRICHEPELTDVVIGPHYASIGFVNDALWFEIDTMLSNAENRPVWDDEHIQYEHLLTGSRHETEMEFENLRYRNTYYYRIRKACATIESSAGVQDSVIYSPWVVDSFMTQYDTTPTIRLLSPKTDSTYIGPITVSFDVSVNLGTDPIDGEGVVRISVVDRDTRDTVLRDWTTDTTYDCFIKRSGDYSVSVLLMRKDSTMRTDFEEVGAIVARHNISIDLPDIAATPVIEVKDAKPCGDEHTYYDSVRIEISCAAEYDSLLYSINGTDWQTYTASFWLKTSERIYAVAVKDSMDETDTAINIHIVSDPMIIKSVTNSVSYEKAVRDWLDFRATVNVEFDNLRDEMYFVVVGEDGRDPIVRLDVDMEPTNTNTVVNNMRRNIYPAAAPNTAYPAIMPGVYHDTILYIVNDEVVYKVALTFFITNINIPRVKIDPGQGSTFVRPVTAERQIKVAMDWDWASVANVDPAKSVDYYEIHYTLDGSTPTRELTDNCFKYNKKDGVVIADSEHAEAYFVLKAKGFDMKQVDKEQEAVDSAVYRITNRAVVEAVEAEELFYIRNILEPLEDTLHYLSQFITNRVYINIRPRVADGITAISVEPVENITAGTLNFRLALNRDMNLMPGEYQDTIILTTSGRELKRTVVNLTITYFHIPKVKIMPVGGTYEHEVEISMSCASEEHPGYAYEIRYTTTANDRPQRDFGEVYTRPFKLSTTNREESFLVRALAYDRTRRDSTFRDSLVEVRYTLTNTPGIIGKDTLVSYTITTQETLNKTLEYTAINLRNRVAVKAFKRASDTVMPLIVTPDTIRQNSDRITLTLRTEGELRAGNYQDTIRMTYLDGTDKLLKRVVVDLTVEALKLPAPVFKPEPGHYYDSVAAVIACANEGTTIMYRVSDTAAYRVFASTDTLLFKDTVTVQAFAWKDNWFNSDTVKAVYTVCPTPDTVSAPVFSPSPLDTVFADSVWVTLTCDTLGADIYYSLDGTTPWRLYAGEFPLIDTTLVRAYAVKEGLISSDTVEALYYVENIIPDTVSVPVFSPSAVDTVFRDSVWVTISCATLGADIYYSLDGAAVTLYTGQFPLTDTTLVKAYAVKDGFVNSAEAEALYYVEDTRVSPEVLTDTLPVPVFTPSAVDTVFRDSVWVTISCDTAGADIYYSLDGAAAALYTGQFPLTDTTLVRAYAVKEGFANSAVAEALYYVEDTRVAPEPVRPDSVLPAPVFHPAGGRYDDEVEVMLTCDSSYADIYYRIEPATEYTLYTKFFTLNDTVRVWAFASKPQKNMVNSDTVYADYLITKTVETPVFTPEPIEGQPFIDSVEVAISCPDKEAEIYYSLDGSTPSLLYTTPLVLYSTVTVKAMAVKQGWNNSDIAEAFYQVIPGNPLDTVATPVMTVISETFDITENAYLDYVTIQILCATDSAEILYSLDGRSPSILYTRPITLRTTATVKAIAKKAGWKDSEEVENTYVIKPSDPDADTVAMPVFNPEEGEYEDDVTVTLSCATPGAVILFRMSDVAPYMVYRKAMHITSTTTIQAMATKEGWYESQVVYATYTIKPSEPEMDTVADPVITPESGVYREEVEVSIACATEDADIFYSIDGSEPSMLYTGPFKLRSDATVKAMARKDKMVDSREVQAEYKVEHEKLYLNVYPIPSVNSVFVELEETATIDVISVKGIILQSIKLGAGVHEIFIHTPGYYVIRATSGDRKVVERAIIQ